MNYKTIIALILATVVGGMIVNAVYNQPLEVTNVKEQVATTTLEVVEELPEDWLEEAEAARQAVIDRKRAEAELEDVQAQIEGLRERETELEKELLVY